MPSRSIHDQQGMCVGGHGSGDLFEVQFHRFGIDAWQDQPCGCSASRTGRPEDIAPFVARIARGARAYPALCPDAGQRPCRPTLASSWSHISKGFPIARSGRISATRGEGSNLDGIPTLCGSLLHGIPQYITSRLLIRCMFRTDKMFRTINKNSAVGV